MASAAFALRTVVLERSMYRVFGVAVVSLAVLAVPAAASESSMLALEAGFLLGHAQRCGISTDRVERVGKPIRDAIAAAADDSDQEKAAGSRFQLIFRASAYPDTETHSLMPDCTRIVRQFERLEQHRSQTASASD